MKCILTLICQSMFVYGLKYEQRGQLLTADFNNQNLSWKCEIHKRFYGVDEKDFKKFAGLKFREEKELPTRRRNSRSSSDIALSPQLGRLYPPKADIPKTFDWRTNTKCQSFFDVRYQGACGACWAVTSAAVMSDRYCLWTNMSRIFSSWDIATCLSRNPDTVCSGNTARNAFTYYLKYGVVSGGDPTIPRQPKGCVPYPKNYYQLQYELKCPFRCTVNKDMNYDREKKFGTDLKLISGVEAIQREIYENGPVLAGFRFHSDFMFYKSGVYYKTTFGKYVGGHAVRLIGWGVEKGFPYWLGINNWASDWGDNGYFKFIRGVNMCGIESNVLAMMPMEAYS